MTSPVNFIDPTGFAPIYIDFFFGGSGDVDTSTPPTGPSNIVSDPEPGPTTGGGTSSGGSGAGSGSGTVKLSDGRTVSSNDEGVIVPSMTDLYYDTLEYHNGLTDFDIFVHPGSSVPNTGVYFADFTLNVGASTKKGFGFGFSGGYSYVMNLNEGWVAEYAHVGPSASFGVSSISGQMSAGSVSGDMSSPRYYEGAFFEFTASSFKSYTKAVSFSFDSYADIIQDGYGFETNVGVSGGINYYYLTNVVYVNGGQS
jgi:hypothetical protein